MQLLANKLLALDNNTFYAGVEWGIPGYKNSSHRSSIEEPTSIYLTGACRETLVSYLKNQKDSNYFAIVAKHGNVRSGVVQFKKFINYLESIIRFEPTVVAYSDNSCVFVGDRKWFNPVLISLYSLLIKHFLQEHFRFYKNYPQRSFERILAQLNLFYYGVEAVKVINLLINGNTVIYDDYWNHSNSYTNSYGELVRTGDYDTFGISRWLEEFEN